MPRSACGRGTGRRTRASSSSRRPRSGCSSYEARQLVRTARRRSACELGPPGWARGVANQSIFHLSQFTLLLHDFERRGNNLGLCVLPRPAGNAGHARVRRVLRRRCARRHAEIDRVQVTNREMEALVLETGIAPEKVHRIPIGIDVDAFRSRDGRGTAAARATLGLPGTRVRRRLVPEGRRRLGRGARAEADQGPGRPPRGRRTPAERVPELRLPAHRPRARATSGRGSSASASRTATCSCPTSTRSRRCTAAIDVCLVASRDEGGPRAVLESMATGVPLVTTRVGQAADLVGTARTAGSSRSRTSTGSSTWIAPRRGGRRRRARARPRGRPSHGRGELLRRAPAAVAAICSRASWRSPRGAAEWRLAAPERRPLRARSGHAGRASSPAAVARPGLRVFYGHDRVPARASPPPAARRSSRSSPRASRTARPTSRSSTSARPASRATSGRSSAARAAPRVPIVVNQDGVGYPGWAGDRTEELNRPLRAAVLGGRPRRSTRASSRKRSADLFLGEPTGTWEILPNAVDVDRFTPGAARRPTGRSCSSAATRRRRTGSSSRSRRSPRPRRASGRAPPRHRPARLRPGAARRRARRSTGSRPRRAVRAARRAGVCPPRAPAAAHEGERPVPDARARGDGLRAPGRLSRRAAARSSSSATRRDRRSARRTARARRAAERRRLSPTRSTRVLADRERYAAAARRRAVERFALEPLARPSRGALRELASGAARRRSRAGGRGASRRGSRARSRSRARRARRPTPPTGRTSMRPTVRGGTGASAAGSRRSRRRGARPPRARPDVTPARVRRPTSDGSYSMRAPARSARTT